MKNFVKGIGFIVILLFFPIYANAQTISYRDGITMIASNIHSKINQGNIIALVDFEASNRQFADTILNDLASALLASNVRLVERRNIEHIMREQNFQYSGYVSDESMISLGKMLGAYAIIVGSGENLADFYRMSFRMLAVETAEVLMLNTINVRYDATMMRILHNQNLSDIGSTRFLIGARLGLGFGINTADVDMVGVGFTPNEKSNRTFNSALFGAFKINPHWFIQPEFNFILNNGIEISGQGNTINIEYPTLDIPILVRWNFIQAPVLAGIVLGPYISMPIGKLNLTVDNTGSALEMNGYTFGITGGLTLGYRLGPGFLTADIRYLNDFSSLNVRNDFGDGMQNAKIMIRRSVNLTFGYEISL